MIGSEIKIVAAIAVVVAALGLYGYVQSLRADLATSLSNNAVLDQAVEQQRKAIDKMQKDIKTGSRLSKELDTSIKAQTQDIKNLSERLINRQDKNGNSVDLGALAVKKTAAIEKRINRGTDNAYRCIEIASGAPLTEQERNATKPSEINTECPSLANPSYQP